MGRHISDEELLQALSNDAFHVGLAQWEKQEIEHDSRSDLDPALDDACTEIERIFSEPPPAEYAVYPEWDDEDVITQVFDRPLVPANPPKLEEPEKVVLGAAEADWFAGLTVVEAAWFLATIVSTTVTPDLVEQMMPYARIW